MRPVLAAYGYYIRSVVRNRFRALISRLRKPRYLVGIILAVAYLWFFLLRPLSLGTETEGSASGIRAATQAFYLLQFLTTWLFGAIGRGILFRESEVEILFPAPLSRPQILLFKFLQTQVGIVITALVFGVLVQRSLPDRPYPLLVFSIWLASTALQVHATWATLLLKSIGLRGGLHKILAWLPGAILLATFMGLVWKASVEVDGISDLSRIVDIGGLRTFMTPFRFLSDFILVAVGLKFLLSTLVLFAAIAIFAALVVAGDHRFEDQALKTARQLSRLKKDGTAGLESPEKQIVKARARAFPTLLRTGPLWRALVWKNVLSVGRIRRNTARILIMVMPMIVIMVVFMKEDYGAEKGLAAAAFICLMTSLYGCLLGPSILRVDLRLDIPHFDVLKSLPIRGRDLLLGEVLGPTILIFAAQVVLLALGLALFPDGLIDELNWRRRIMGFVIALPFFLAFDFTMFTLENLLALHLPSFVRFGRGFKPGFDQFGQNLLGAVVRGLVLMLLFLPAILVGGGVGFALALSQVLSIELAVFVGILVASSVLALVAYLLLVYSEKRYESFDLSSESLSIDA